MSDDGGGERVGPGPFSHMLGFRLLEAGEDGAVMEVTPGPDHVNGGGIVHGGFLSALLDSTTGWAVHAAFTEPRVAPHAHLSVQYLRPARPGIPLVCRGRCLRAGRRVAAAEAEVFQDGVVVARAVTSHAVIDPG